MAAHYYLFLFSLLITFSLCFGKNSSPKLPLYRVVNLVPKHPGGKRFDKELGIPFTKKVMATVNKFIWDKAFEQHTAADRKPMDSVNLYIDGGLGYAGQAWGNNNTNVSAIHIGNYKGNLKFEFQALLYHEMTHLFQWNGEGKTPPMLVEGIAQYVRLKANFTDPDYFQKPGSGDKWDQGYDFTARFLEYCDGLVPGFVAKLNKMMRKTFDVKYFQNLTGKPVDQLWKQYKAKHGTVKKSSYKLPLYRVANLVPKHPGGILFDKEIGIPFAKKVMGTVNKFIWDTLFEQHTAADRKNLDSVNLYIVEGLGFAGETWGNNNTNVSAIYIHDHPKNLKWELTSLLYHELCHVFQWNGEGKTPPMLVEGIAQYSKLKSKNQGPMFAPPGTGDKWDQGYDITARFLEYCDGLVPGFVAKLNKMMRKTFDVKYFQNLTGKPVDQLWKEYKAKHRHKV